MQREDREEPSKLRIFHVLLRLITVVSRLVQHVLLRLSYGALRSLTVFTPFYYVCHVLLRLSRRVKFIDIKRHIIGISSFILEQ